MEKFLKKIFSKDKQNLLDQIIKDYKKNGFLIINFIYFAVFKKNVLDDPNLDYIKALNDCNFLLPDWIALKIYLKKKLWKKVENLNWTDFTPYLLNKLSTSNTHIGFYTVYDEKIWKNKTDLEKVFYYIKNNFKYKKIESFLSHYSKRWEDFDFEWYKKSLKQYKYDYKIFLVWIWNPFQEIWVNKNIDFFIKNNILVMNVWWLFDFWANFEKRAPDFIRKLNLEWLWRLFQNPKKNIWKVLDSFKLFIEILKK